MIEREGHSVREILLDFYGLVATALSAEGYRYRKSKGEIYKKIGGFTILLEFQSFSGNGLGGEIEVEIHRTICFFGAGGRACYLPIGGLLDGENRVTGSFDIRYLTKEGLEELLLALGEYIRYMEQLVGKFLRGEGVGLWELKLVDPYGEVGYESSGIGYEDRFYGKEAGLTYRACRADGSLDEGLYRALLGQLEQRKWYEYYTEESVRRVYEAFYRFLGEGRLGG